MSLPGSAGLPPLADSRSVRTARQLVRHALHEARHHIRDIASVGRAIAGT
jgi:hypothetical protein